MLNSFLEWARQVGASHGARGVESRVTEGPSSDNPSARLDIDAPTTVARITCWESGNYDAEVIDLETERTLYSSHGVFQEDRSIAEQVSPFIEALNIAAK